MDYQLHRYKGKSNWKKWVPISAFILILLCASGLYVIGLLDAHPKDKPAEPISPVTDNTPPEGLNPPGDTSPIETPVTTPPEPPKPSRPEELKYAYVTQSQIADGTADLKAKAQSGEINAVIVEYKDSAGKVTDADLTGYIKELKDSDLYVIASVYAFRDNLQAKNDRNACILYSKDTLWLDAGNKLWLSPYTAGACDYVTSVVDRAITAGFDEVMLFECNFPSNGKTSVIYYGDTAGVTKSQCIENFVAKLAETRTISLAIPQRAANDQAFAENIGLGFTLKDLPIAGLYTASGTQINKIN